MWCSWCLDKILFPFATWWLRGKKTKKALRKTGGLNITYVLYGLKNNGLFQSSLVANGKLVAAFCTTASQHFAAIGAFHALTKAVYAFAATIMWLECSFHN